jgi:hypothetical protein
MQTATGTTPQQASPLLAKEGLQRAVIDLVGDLAAYRPDAKLVIFEGENSEFDQRMTAALFPSLQQKVNTVSAGNKQRVRGLHDILSVALDRGQVPMQIFSIVDSDAEEINPVQDRSFAWDAYHIENYLLEPSFILKIVRDLGSSSFSTEEEVYEALRECAKETMPSLVRHHLASTVHAELVKAIQTTTDPKSPQVAPVLANVIERSIARISKMAEGTFSLSNLVEKEATLNADFEKSLAADTWRRRFRGRDILSRFAGRIGKTTYEVFRDLIVANMRDSRYEPPGMRNVIDKSLAA